MKLIQQLITITTISLALMISMSACKDSTSSEDNHDTDTVYVWQDNLFEIGDYYYGMKTGGDGIDSTQMRLMEISPCDTCPSGWEFIVFAWEFGDFYLFHDTEEQVSSKVKGLTNQDRLQLSTGH